MTNDERSPNDELPLKGATDYLDFVIPSSFLSSLFAFIRVIRGLI